MSLQKPNTFGRFDSGVYCSVLTKSNNSQTVKSENDILTLNIFMACHFITNANVIYINRWFWSLFVHMLYNPRVNFTPRKQKKIKPNISCLEMRFNSINFHFVDTIDCPMKILEMKSHKSIHAYIVLHTYVQKRTEAPIIVGVKFYSM